MFVTIWLTGWEGGFSSFDFVGFQRSRPILFPTLYFSRSKRGHSPSPGGAWIDRPQCFEEKWCAEPFVLQPCFCDSCLHCIFSKNQRLKKYDGEFSERRTVCFISGSIFGNKQRGRQRKRLHLGILLPNVALLVQLPNLPIVQQPQREPQAARASHLQDAWKLESGRNCMGDGTRKSSGTDAQNGKPGSLYKGSKLFQAAKGVFSV